MVKINFIFFCNSAEISQGTNNLNALGIFDTIGANNFSAVHKLMFIVVSFDIDAGPHRESFKITLDGRPILSSKEFNFDVTGEKHQFVHRVENLVLPEPGKYKVEISIDGSPCGDNHFLVKGGTKTNLA